LRLFLRWCLLLWVPTHPPHDSGFPWVCKVGILLSVLPWVIETLNLVLCCRIKLSMNVWAVFIIRLLVNMTSIFQMLHVSYIRKQLLSQCCHFFRFTEHFVCLFHLWELNNECFNVPVIWVIVCFEKCLLRSLTWHFKNVLRCFVRL
jgi:hypothetical protein